MSTTTTFSLPSTANAAQACSSGPQAATAQTVLATASAGISAGSIVSNATTCTTSGARRELAASGARRLATSASITVTLTLLNSAAAQTAYTALLTLNTGSFATTITALIAAAGPGSYTTTAVSSAAACGNGPCVLPQGSSSSSSPDVNVGAVVGGVVGGFAAIVIIVAAVLYVRHQKLKAAIGSSGALTMPAVSPEAAQPSGSAASGLYVLPSSQPAAAAAAPPAATTAAAATTTSNNATAV